MDKEPQLLPEADNLPPLYQEVHTTLKAAVAEGNLTKEEAELYLAAYMGGLSLDFMSL